MVGTLPQVLWPGSLLLFVLYNAELPMNTYHQAGRHFTAGIWFVAQSAGSVITIVLKYSVGAVTSFTGCQHSVRGITAGCGCVGGVLRLVLAGFACQLDVLAASRAHAAGQHV